MNIHEYQAKQLFKEYGVPVQDGVAVKSEAEFDSAIAAIKGDHVVVKSQIHAGGRGKGEFVDGFKGGVKFVKREEAAATAKRMLGNTIVTKQTGAAGRVVGTVFFAEAMNIKKEFYLSILMDRASSKVAVVASVAGGMDIEKVAEETPDQIMKMIIDPDIGLQAFQIRKLAFFFGFGDKEMMKQFKAIFSGLYKLFIQKDCSMVEINPLILTDEGNIVALDAKVSFDDNALFRHPELEALRDPHEEDPKEIEAGKYGLNYIALDGNIACMVNGAGLAMSTMDIIKHFGGNPANFLDVGGGANEEAITQAFNILLKDKNVKGILVNIFGGIMRCDVIAAGVIAAVKNVGLTLPLVVRLEGTNVDKGRQMLAESGIKLTTADSLADAAEKIVKIVAAENK
ncbi:MAG: ADP-forming succinate--CoA ligase subunit beta [Verrucomicrobiaceae bacterium]|nr:ADP-forming succinate--CoA ligase subunit beta [Verrucomicrobiaceae bacterium]